MPSNGHGLKNFLFTSIEREHVFVPVLTIRVTADFRDPKENLSCSCRLNRSNRAGIQDSSRLCPILDMTFRLRTGTLLEGNVWKSVRRSGDLSQHNSVSVYDVNQYPAAWGEFTLKNSGTEK